jgi:drug/metabolite transporter (DMT)-like permease
MKPSSFQTFLLTTLTMIAFASNSLLNRLALGQATIDALSYTTMRLTSGALILFILATLQKKNDEKILRGNRLSAVLLLLYAVTFSLAYLSLSTGAGALILFSSVQITMLLVALKQGERPHMWEWIGLCLALGGLVYLVLPGLTAPSPLGSASMMIAGVAWGFYSIRGRGSQNPLADTAGNFVLTVPIILLLWLSMNNIHFAEQGIGLDMGNVHFTKYGILLAILSGALASGLGYVIWYAALRGLTTTRAAIVQLSVPVIAAWGGVLLLAETVSTRLLLAGVLILGGIGLSVLSRGKD